MVDELCEIGTEVVVEETADDEAVCEELTVENRALFSLFVELEIPVWIIGFDEVINNVGKLSSDEAPELDCETIDKVEEKGNPAEVGGELRESCDDP